MHLVFFNNISVQSNSLSFKSNHDFLMTITIIKEDGKLSSYYWASLYFIKILTFLCQCIFCSIVISKYEHNIEIMTFLKIFSIIQKDHALCQSLSFWNEWSLEICENSKKKKCRGKKNFSVSKMSENFWLVLKYFVSMLL